jgi:hypothetical protein
MSIFEKVRSLLRPQPRAQASMPEQSIVTNLKNPAMLNTIAISPEMETFYLIDNGKAIPFALLEGRGIVISLVEGQINVATAVRIPKMEEEAESPIDLREAVAFRSEVMEKGRKIRIIRLSTEKTIWSVAFHSKNAALCFIGATEVEVRRPAEKEELEYKPSVEFFELNKESVYMRRLKDHIVLVGLPRPERDTPA